MVSLIELIKEIKDTYEIKEESLIQA